MMNTWRYIRSRKRTWMPSYVCIVLSIASIHSSEDASPSRPLLWSTRELKHAYVKHPGSPAWCDQGEKQEGEQRRGNDSHTQPRARAQARARARNAGAG